MTLLPFAGRYGDLPLPERVAVVELLAPRYLALSYPAPAAIAGEYGVTPGTPAFAAREAELLRRWAVTLASSFAAHDGISALFAPTRRGGVAAVAAMQTIRGARPVAIARSIGDEASSLPTHRTHRAFRYPPLPGFRADETPESALAEFSHLAVADRGQLLPLLEDGALTRREADYVVRHGIDELVVRSVWRDRALPEPPRVYLFNTQPRLARVLVRKGLALHPLFLDGAEPTPRVLRASPYFRRWQRELAAVAPPDILREGLAATVRHLVARGFAGWHTLAISLPYLLPNDAALARAIARLEAACALPPIDAGEVRATA